MQKLRGYLVKIEPSKGEKKAVYTTATTPQQAAQKVADFEGCPVSICCAIPMTRKQWKALKWA